MKKRWLMFTVLMITLVIIGCVQEYDFTMKEVNGTIKVLDETTLDGIKCQAVVWESPKIHRYAVSSVISNSYYINKVWYFTGPDSISHSFKNKGVKIVYKPIDPVNGLFYFIKIDPTPEPSFY